MSDIEEQIRQAMQAGKFDNLKGKGKKLSLEDNPLADPEWRLAHHMLQSSGYTLPWIENRQQLDEEIQKTRAALRQAWEWRQSALAKRQFPDHLIAEEWERAETTFRASVADLNRRIRSYNLEAPSEQVHLPLLNPSRELARLQEKDQANPDEPSETR